jgi:hypothetical protein
METRYLFGDSEVARCRQELDDAAGDFRALTSSTSCMMLSRRMLLGEAVHRAQSPDQIIRRDQD